MVLCENPLFYGSIETFVSLLSGVANVNNFVSKPKWANIKGLFLLDIIETLSIGLFAFGHQGTVILVFSILD